MNTMFDFAPLWRSGIGFDHLFNMLEQVGKTDQAENYPPYDIERAGEDAYRLTLALAGWTPDEITVTTEPNLLVVSGQKSEPENKQYLYRGIPPVGCARRFNLADYVEVSDAWVQNGHLTIGLVRTVPGARKPRRGAGANGGTEQESLEDQPA